MVSYYMLTIPRDEQHDILKLWSYINTHDVHKWVIGRETGRNGYQHWQCRIKTSDPDFFKFEEQQQPFLTPDWKVEYRKVKVGVGWVNRNIPRAHVEECSDTWDYETKEGMSIASWDTPEVLRLRFGRMRWWQECAVEALRTTNDREVMVWYDPTGNNGKSWLVGHLYETGQAYYLPPTMTSVQSMLQTIASLAHADREDGRPPREFVLIDIPRSWKWSKELYTAIETIKDGLLLDPRYSARPINIRGVKVMVLTNTRPELDKLSQDRWYIWNTPMH